METNDPIKPIVSSRIAGAEVFQATAEPRDGTIQFGYEQISGRASISAGYRRDRTLDQTNASGQDYLVFRHSPHFVIGVVSDGVTRSFAGDIAAIAVSNHLIDLLWDWRRAPPNAREVEQTLQALGTAVSNSLDERYDALQRSTPPDSSLSRTISRRYERGSQVVFAAFILNLTSRKLIVYQAGEVSVSIKVVGENRWHERLGRSGGRWSSKGDTDLHITAEEFCPCEAVIVNSDGAGEGFGSPKIKGHGQIEEDEFRQWVLSSVESDDIAFICVTMSPSSHISKTSALRPLEMDHSIRVAPTSNPAILRTAARNTGQPDNAAQNIQPTSSLRPPRAASQKALWFLAASVLVVMGGLLVSLKTSKTRATTDAKITKAVPHQPRPVMPLPGQPQAQPLVQGPLAPPMDERSSALAAANQEFPLAFLQIAKLGRKCADTSLQFGLSEIVTPADAVVCLYSDTKVIPITTVSTAEGPLEPSWQTDPIDHSKSIAVIALAAPASIRVTIAKSTSHRSQNLLRKLSAKNLYLIRINDPDRIARSKGGK